MILSLAPEELNTLADQLKAVLLPLLIPASESGRGSMKLLTVDEVADNAGVVRKTVENWIASGKLRATADWGSDKRPLYRVSVAAFWEFYDNNPVIIRNARNRGRSVARKR
ncbi:excisionase family DNA-binding protein [Hymenobacter monticola]|uniref:Helix-turn-helix domain-containing protein n=1 Tax=Hymenobacter monticola TaxID=1705399 RepID=A0ABY4B0B3_9BACT|nr:excisionase family DNA-binding protein [Hymenobacter monticola]UOE32219.1 helix-turn-helix domain-containing protein [Hymenobacter monticola]